MNRKTLFIPPREYCNSDEDWLETIERISFEVAEELKLISNSINNTIEINYRSIQVKFTPALGLMEEVDNTDRDTYLVRSESEVDVILTSLSLRTNDIVLHPFKKYEIRTSLERLDFLNFQEIETIEYNYRILVSCKRLR